MSSVTKFAVISLCSFVYSLPAWAQVHVPGPGEGYQVSPSNDTHQNAPSGYEGRTDSASQTAAGNTPATTGKTITSHFTFGNQVKSCPDADGKIEGTGLFSISIDYSDSHGTTQHIEVRANAKYKGQVADNALVEGPVNADIDYSYTLSGRTRESNGAMTTPAGSNVQQHITLPVLVSPKMMGSPDFGAFSGGDPTAGHYAEAIITAQMLSYWGGVYFSIAESKWLQGQCAEVVFTPPSYTLQPPLGTQATVKAEVKTKAGATTRGLFTEVAPLNGAGSVEVIGGPSDVGYPIKFIYTAPAKKVAKAGFQVKATSRAGAATGDWNTGLGTGWSGQISCTQTSSGDAGGDQGQSWSNYQVTRLTITVKDGVGTGSGYFEQKNTASNRRPVANYANPKNPSWADDGSSSSEGTASGESKATVEITLDKSKGTYWISAGLNPTSSPMGKLHSTVCIPNRGCTEHDSPLGMPSCLQGIDGKFSDPNQLQGAVNDHKTGLGRLHNGTYTYEMTWNLARTGSK